MQDLLYDGNALAEGQVEMEMMDGWTGSREMMSPSHDTIWWWW
jgi:hypothetical protein